MALGRFTLRQSSEGALQQRHDVISREVTTQHQSHVASHIVSAEKVLHVRKARILQVLGAANDRILVGMPLEGSPYNPFHSTRYHVVGSTVLLFIHRFQLPLEQAEHGIDHTLRVQFTPLFEELRCERVMILRHVPRCRGVQRRATIFRDESVELVGNGIVCRPLTQPTDVALYGQPFLGIPCLRQFIVFH